MSFRRSWFGQKRIVCDGCGLSLPVWKATNWMVSEYNSKTFHPTCRDRSGGDGTYTPLRRV